DDAVVHSRDNLFAGVRPVLHEGTGHPWHRGKTIRLAPAGTRGGHLVVTRADGVVQVRLQDAVFHQYRAPAFVTLVVVVERATLFRDRRLVHDSNEGLGHRFADHVGIDARALAVEVGFHAVADRLVQQDAAGTSR